MTDSPRDAFPYAVASFDPDATSVLLWTRVAGAGELRWEVATDPELRHVVRNGRVDVAPDGSGAGTDDPGGRTDHPDGGRGPDGDAGGSGPGAGGETSCVVHVGGLPPATTLYYRFTRGRAESPVGRTRTLPVDDRAVRLGLVCCGDYSAGHFSVYRALAEADVDLVVHLGDYVYAEGHADARAVEPAHDAVTRADYEARYRQVRSDPDLQALHLRHAMAAVIDDHDLADNAARDGAKTHDPDEHGPWADRLEAAVAARAEWVPVRSPGPIGRRAPAQWRAIELGAVGELVLLDTRLDDRDLPPDVGGPDIDDPARTMLGRRQIEWVEERISDRSRPWCLLVSSVVLNPVTVTLPVEATVGDVLPDGYLVSDGVAMNTDGWDGYPAERRRLTAAMRARGSGTLVVSGDVHSSWAFEGPADDEGPVAVELTCPATTSTPMGRMVPVFGGLLETVLAEDAGVRWADLYGHGHLVLEVDPQVAVATWWFTDPEDPSAEARPVARWAARVDRPGHLDEIPLTDEQPDEHAGPSADRPDRAPHGADGPGGAGTDGRGDRLDATAPAEPTVPGRPRTLLRALDRRERRVRLALAASGAAAVVLAWGRRQRTGSA